MNILLDPDVKAKSVLAQPHHLIMEHLKLKELSEAVKNIVHILKRTGH